MARHRFEDSNQDVRLSDQDFEVCKGLEDQFGPALQRIFGMARKWRHLQREIRQGEAVVLVKEGCSCFDTFWSDRAQEDATRVVQEWTDQQEADPE